MKIQKFMRIHYPDIILNKVEEIPVKNMNVPQDPPEGAYGVQFFDRDVTEDGVKRVDDFNFSPVYMWGEEITLKDLEIKIEIARKKYVNSLRGPMDAVEHKEIEKNHRAMQALNSLVANMKAFKADRVCKTIRGTWVIMRPGDLAFE